MADDVKKPKTDDAAGVVKGQRSCDKASLDSMLTASSRVLVDTIPVHFTGRSSEVNRDGVVTA